MVRFDGYTATTTEANHYQLADLFGPGMESKEGHGFHQFGHRLSLRDSVGEVGAVQWGGSHGGRTMIEVKGERSPEVVERLRTLFPDHRATRLDSAVDWDHPGAFEGLLDACMKVKQAHRLKGERQGDWQDFPELGRTQYLGASKSPIRLRLYEKGKQPELVHLARPNLTRAELQVRPAKDAKSSFAKLSALEVWGASSWTRDLAGELLAAHVDPHPAGTVWRKTGLERRLDWLCKQGGPTLLELHAELGSWECVGLTLGERLKAKA